MTAQTAHTPYRSHCGDLKSIDRTLRSHDGELQTGTVLICGELRRDVPGSFVYEDLCYAFVDEDFDGAFAVSQVCGVNVGNGASPVLKE